MDTAARPPDARADDLEDERVTAFGRMVEAYARLSRAFDRSLQEHCEISDAWFEVLLRLGRSPDRRLTTSQLAEQLAITAGGVTRLIDRILAAGYVERQPCPDDRRVQWVVLTESGRAKLEPAYRRHIEDLDEELFDRLTDRDVADLNRIMEKLRAA